MVRKKAVGYCRKSPDDKEDTQTSIENQKKIIIETSKKLDLELVGIFVDLQISGSDRNRKEFLNMMKVVYGSDVEIILVKAQDRFARDTAFFMDTLDIMNGLNKKLYSCIENNFVSSDNLGDNLRSFIDGQYVRDQRKKAEVVLSQKMDEGKPIGNPIFGYKYNYKFDSSGSKVPIDSSLEINEWIIETKQAKIVLSVISDYVNNVNFSATIKDLGIDKSKYYRIIKNAKMGLYSGFTYYVRKHKSPTKEILRVENITYKCRHKIIISDELFNQVKSKNGL